MNYIEDLMKRMVSVNQDDKVKAIREALKVEEDMRRGTLHPNIKIPTLPIDNTNAQFYYKG